MYYISFVTFQINIFVVFMFRLYIIINVYILFYFAVLDIVLVGD